MKSTRGKLFTGSRWWLEGGDEDCPHCGHPYHREVELRCDGCDASGCRHCVLVERGTRQCPECVAAPADE